MPEQSSAATFLKGLFYKTCFCIGLGTVSYYSYGQVQKWVNPSLANPSMAISTIQDKVDSLTSPSGTTTTAMSVHGNPAQDVGIGFHPNPKAYLALEVKKPVTPDPLVGAISEASPSPSPSPADGDKKEGEAAKDGEKKDGEKKEGEAGKPDGEQVAEGSPAPGSLAQPYAYNPNSQPDSNAGPAASPADPSANLPNGISNPTTPSGITSTGGGGGASNTATATSLTAADVAMLSASMKALFSSAPETVPGQVCPASSPTSGCIANNGTPVWTNRWSTTEGLSDVTFSVAAAGSTQIKVTITLKLQDLSQNAQTATVSVVPSQVVSHVETRSGKLYKIFDVKLPDTTTSSGDRLSGMDATLVYAENAAPAGGGTMTTDSKFVFNRTKVQTLSSQWDFTGQTNRAPAATDQIFVADSLNYSINLEKSP